MDSSQTFDVDGANVVYVSVRGGQSNLYLYNLSDQTETLVASNLTIYSANARVQGDNVIYADQTDAGVVLYSYNIKDKTTIALNSPSNSVYTQNFDIYGNYIIWMSSNGTNGDHPFNIHIFDIAQKTDSLLCSATDDCQAPTIYNNKIAYTSYPGGTGVGQQTINVYDTQTKSNTVVASGGTFKADASIVKDRVVWWENPNNAGLSTLFSYNTNSGGISTVASNIDSSGKQLVVSNTMAVIKGLNSGIKMINLATGTVTDETLSSTYFDSNVVLSNSLLFYFPGTLGGNCIMASGSTQQECQTNGGFWQATFTSSGGLNIKNLGDYDVWLGDKVVQKGNVNIDLTNGFPDYTQSMLFTVVPSDGSGQTSDGFTVVSSYDIGAVDQNGVALTNGFDAHITLGYPSTLNPSAGSFTIRYWNGADWSAAGITNIIINTNLHQISFDTSHFSRFAIVSSDGTIITPPNPTPPQANPVVANVQASDKETAASDDTSADTSATSGSDSTTTPTTTSSTLATTNPTAAPTTAKAAEANSNNKFLLFIFAAVVVALGIAIFVYKRLRPKNIND